MCAASYFDTVYSNLNYGFTAVYVVEILVRIWVLGGVEKFWQDYWNRFILLVTFVNIIEVPVHSWLLALSLLIEGTPLIAVVRSSFKLRATTHRV